METFEISHTYLSFSLNDELFAAHVDKVLNIIEYRKITRIPDAPHYLKGVINLRGRVLPVIDMRIKFNMPEIEPTIETSIIVVNTQVNKKNIQLGMLVDSVCEVLEVNPLQIEPPPGIDKHFKMVCVHGLWRKDDKFIMLLNIDAIFEANEILAVENSDSKS
mgnify:CR=1 FL=1